MRKKVVYLQEYRSGMNTVILMLKKLKSGSITKQQATTVLDFIMKKLGKKRLYVDDILILRQRNGSILICLPGIDDYNPVENVI